MDRIGAYWVHPLKGESSKKHLTIEKSLTTYTYDAAGTRSGWGYVWVETHYSYDYENRLVSADDGQQVIDYEYDADGIRTAKTVDGVRTDYLVDKNRTYAQVLEETDDAGYQIAGYVYGDDLISQQRGAVSYYLYDGQLSTRQLTDDTEAVTDTYSFDAFGSLTSQTGVTENNYLYTGEQYDPNAGFYYLRVRYYDQGVGRFITTDPWIGEGYDPVSLHKYLYTGYNPIQYNDPSGLVFTINGLMNSSVVQTAIRSAHGKVMSSFALIGPAFARSGKVGKTLDRLVGQMQSGTASAGANPQVVLFTFKEPSL